MPTDYTSDPTAAQSPGTAPEPTSAPVLRMPNSGEGATAAGIRQFIKALGDHVAWLFQPRARTSQYVEPVRVYRNSRLHSRSGIDHMGFPAGRILTIQDDWGEFATTQGTAGGTGVVGPWSWQVSKTGSPTAGVLLFPPGASFPNVPGASIIGLQIGRGAVNDFTQVWRTVDVVGMSPDLEAVIEFDVAMSGVGNTTFIAGLARTNVTDAPVGAYMLLRDGDTAWQSFVKNGAGGTATSSSSVAPTAGSAWHRIRIELRGSGTDDNSTSRVIFYVDGVLRTNQITPSPFQTAGMTLTVIFGGFTTATGGSTINMYVTPPTLRIAQLPGSAGLF